MNNKYIGFYIGFGLSFIYFGYKDHKKLNEYKLDRHTNKKITKL
jgi:hypothetical protein